MSGKMGNEPGKYENFGLLVYGGTAEAEVDDETAGKFRLRWEDGQPKTVGDRRCPVSVFVMEQGAVCPEGENCVVGDLFGQRIAGLRLE